MRMRKLTTTLTAVLAVSLTAACGSSDSNAQEDGESQSVTVSVMPIVDVTSLYLGEEQGIFDKHGIDLKLSVTQSGAAATAAVMSGESQFGFAAPVPLIQAQAKKLPVVVVGGAIAQGDSLSQGVVVPKGSTIKGIKDLAGKTVAVNALQGLNDLVLRDLVEEAGGDPEKINFIALPYPDMNAALESKRVDAAWLLEPFLSAATGEGLPVVVDNPQMQMAGPDTTLSVYFTNQQYVAENEETVTKFVAALEEANEYAQKHEDETRATIPTFTQIPEGTAQKMALGDFRTEIDKPTFEILGEAMTRYGWIDEAPDLETLIRTP